LLEFHTKYINIIRETFANDSDFISSLDKACAIIVNMKKGNRLSTKAPELVSEIRDEIFICFSFSRFSLHIIVIVYYVNQRKQRVKMK
jgi:hypothetical protein